MENKSKQSFSVRDYVIDEDKKSKNKTNELHCFNFL